MTRLGDVSFATLLNYQSDVGVRTRFSQQFVFQFSRGTYLCLVVFLASSSEVTATGVELQILQCKYCVFQLGYLISGVVLQSRVLQPNSILLSAQINGKHKKPFVTIQET